MGLPLRKPFYYLQLDHIVGFNEMIVLPPPAKRKVGSCEQV